ncbi:MAG: hypothetical protein J6W28_07215 [Clostridia bacterium]|nr:hypothetical protein [Clostridia bacterium]
MDKLLSVVLIAIISFFILLLIFYLGTVLYRFRLQMQYINMEIGRTEGREREYWLYQKRKLIHTICPLYPKHKKKH